MILLLLTLMMFFALRVGVFDQRNSSNEMRQKLAFHVAESAIAHAKEFFRANSLLAASLETGIMGTNGWLSTATRRLALAEMQRRGLESCQPAAARIPVSANPIPPGVRTIYYYSFNGIDQCAGRQQCFDQ